MYTPQQAQILEKAPKFNTFYRPEKSRTVYLSQVARVAAKNAGLPDNMTFPTIKAIAASPWNSSHIEYTSKGYENYGIQGPSYAKRYSAEPRAMVGSGSEYPVIWIPDPRNPKEPGQVFKIHVDKPTEPVEPTKPVKPIEPVEPIIIPEEPPVGPIVSPEIPGVIILEPIDEDSDDLIDEILITDGDKETIIPIDEIPGEIEDLIPTDGEITIPIKTPDGKTVIVKGHTKKQLAAAKKKIKRDLEAYLDRRIDQRLAQLQKQKGNDMSWAAVPLFSLVALL